MKKIWGLTLTYNVVVAAEEEDKAIEVAKSDLRLAGLPNEAISEVVAWGIESEEDLPAGWNKDFWCADEGELHPISKFLQPKSATFQVSGTDEQLERIRKALEALGIPWVE